MAGLSNNAGAAPMMNVPGMQKDDGGPVSNKELMKGARAALAGNYLKVIFSLILYSILISSVWVFFSVAGVVAGRLQQSNLEEGVPAGAIWASLGFTLVALAVTSFFTYGWFNYFRVLAEEGEARLDAFFEGGRKIFATVITYLLLFGLYLAYQYASLMMFLFILNGNMVGMLIGMGVIQFLPIYLMLRYSMVFFLLTDEDEGYGAFGSMGRSSEIMVGFKWKLFCLGFRFWFLGLLVSLPPFMVALVLPMPFVAEYISPESTPLLAVASLIWTTLGMMWLIPYSWTSYGKFYEDVK